MISPPNNTIWSIHKHGLGTFSSPQCSFCGCHRQTIVLYEGIMSRSCGGFSWIASRAPCYPKNTSLISCPSQAPAICPTENVHSSSVAMQDDRMTYKYASLPISGHIRLLQINSEPSEAIEGSLQIANLDDKSTIRRINTSHTGGMWQDTMTKENHGRSWTKLRS